MQLVKVLIENKNVCSQHKFDLVKTKQKINVKLLPISILAKQRPSKVPLDYQEKLVNLLGQLCKAGIIRGKGNNGEVGTEFINFNFYPTQGEHCQIGNRCKIFEFNHRFE